MTTTETIMSSATNNISATSSLSKLDVDKIIKKAQAAYPKKEQGLAKQISTGRSIAKPQDDRDYIQMPPFWKEATSIPGIPLGKFVVAQGATNVGKSSLLMMAMVSAQKQGYAVCLLDSESKFAPNRFEKKMGGKADDLFVVNSNSIEDGAVAIANLVYAIKEVDPKRKILIVWDSISGSVSRIENDSESETFSNQMGANAKEIGLTIRKFAKLINKYCDKETGEHSIAVMMAAQIYMSIPIGFGISVAKTKGGEAIGYFASIIVQLSRKKDLTRIRDSKVYRFGQLTKMRVTKNHMFDGDECIDNIDVVIAADGIHLASEIKSFDDIKGWEDADADEDGVVE